MIEFNFNIIFVVFHDIFSLTDVAFNIHQSESVDITFCCKEVETVKENLCHGEVMVLIIFRSKQGRYMVLQVKEERGIVLELWGMYMEECVLKYMILFTFD